MIQASSARLLYQSVWLQKLSLVFFFQLRPFFFSTRTSPTTLTASLRLLARDSRPFPFLAPQDRDTDAIQSCSLRKITKDKKKKVNLDFTDHMSAAFF